MLIAVVSLAVVFCGLNELERTDAGLAIARQTRAAGEQAMAEWKFRRVGLGISVLAIAVAVIGLGLYIRNIEAS